ncbi:MAG: hypothetical protein ABIH22_02025 [Candidatus Margulisiibacteriota bacterium]
MVNVGKVIPGYAEIGRLRKSIGSYKIKPAAKEGVPLRNTQYSPVSNSRTFLAWQRITSGEVQVDADSILKLNNGDLNAFIYAKEENEVIPGALLLPKDQLTQEVHETLRKMVAAAGKDLNQYSPWIVLLPGLEVNGESTVCFDLSMTGASPEEFGAFVGDRGDTVPDVVALLKQNGNPVLFVNPYYQSPGSLGSQQS